jgi:AraC-like DNA-binding protein
MDVTRPHLEMRGELAWFGCEYTATELRSLGLTVEKELATWLASARNATLRQWAPVAVHLQTPATDLQQYHRFFRAPVHNQAAGCWLVFDSAVLELPVLGADSNLFALLSSTADTLLAAARARRRFADRVRQAMLPLIRDGCRIDEVAAALAMSPRTLQRRLEGEGTTFGAVFDATRQAAALEYLRDPAVGIKEAAFRVGFSEPSTFYRAFRRWTGATPAHFRRAIAS